jgi:glycosyltransferase involved in cell wall biosynthesis
VPFYNAEKFLEAAIASVLNQSYNNWELLLVNDGSTDNSQKIAKKYVDNKKIFLLQHTNGENKGVSISRSLAINNSKGEFISFLDADDFYEDRKLEKNINVLNEFKEVILVHSAANFIGNSKKHGSFFNEFKFPKINEPYSFFDYDFLRKNHICNSSVMVKGKFLKKIDNSFSHIFQYEDWINWILIAGHGQFFYIDEQLCNYRFHDNSSTSFLLHNPIKSEYAKLEMLFILLHRVDDEKIKNKIEFELYYQLQKIFTSYKTVNNLEIDVNSKTDNSLNIIEKFRTYLGQIKNRKNNY